MSDPTPDFAPLKIGNIAYDFTARSTQGDITLDNYRGKWLVFFSHPADFTPVCTSEFLAFARHAPEFARLGCNLLGLSVDSLPSHLAWIDAIHTQLGVTIPFPIIEDPSMAIAKAYGMLDPTAADSTTVRATYIIDPAGIIQATLWYPLTVGRSVPEILRTLAALQHTATHQTLTPESWQPGQDVLIPAATTQNTLKSGNTPWFYRLEKDQHS